MTKTTVDAKLEVIAASIMKLIELQKELINKFNEIYFDDEMHEPEVDEENEQDEIEEDAADEEVGEDGQDDQK